MDFRFDPAERFDKQVRHIAGAELGRAALALETGGDAGGPKAAAKAAFRARKAIKRVRALYKTVRAADHQGLKQAGQELRTIAAALAVLREPVALAKAAQNLARQQDASGPEQAALLRLRDRLRRKQVSALHAGDAQSLLADAAQRCRTASDAIASIHLPKSTGKALHVLEKGLARTARDAVSRLDIARQDNSAASWHAFRSRVKHHRMQMRLLEAAWPGEFRLRADALKLVTDSLGEDHDLAALQARVEADRDLVDWPDDMALVSDAIRQRQQVLRDGAVTGAEYLFADKPDVLAGRVVLLWREAVRLSR